MIDRHDILRTAMLWEQLPRAGAGGVPAGDAAGRGARRWIRRRDAAEQLQRVAQAGASAAGSASGAADAAAVAADRAAASNGTRCCSCITSTCDHVSLEIVIVRRCVAHLEGRRASVAGAGAVSQSCGAGAWRMRGQHDAEAFFRSKLADVDEPTAPFGVAGRARRRQPDRGGARAARPALAQRVRAQARRLGVSAATLFHAAWGLVVARTSGRDDVVFGSVLLGRLQGSAGAQRDPGHVHQYAAAAAAAARRDGSRSWSSRRSASWWSCWVMSRLRWRWRSAAAASSDRRRCSVRC